MTFLILYLLAVNVFGLITMGYDKDQARKKNRRTPEKELFTIAAIGGALGVWIGMRMFRHKTKHMSFVAGVPGLFIVNVICVAAIVRWMLL
ncbi:DUF1294 domain-containing protein [Paenibacillus chartarius]|uniref:DUF1294 domain-containing protein n=1 Tax=Paenibacillus chartarius TaxID=747481 RepID=A0ABV6DPB3_9BACL